MLAAGAHVRFNETAKGVTMYARVHPVPPAADTQSIYLEDERDLEALGRALVEDGFIVSQRVRVRQAFTGYTDSEGNTHESHFFSADPLGGIMLLAATIAYLTEVVVAEGSEPMP
jgi:hypothetical protein